MKAQILAALTILAGSSVWAESIRLESPDQRLALELELVDGTAQYSLSLGQHPIIAPSRLGFQFRDAPPMDRGLSVKSISRLEHDEHWKQPWGECEWVRDLHNELRVELRDTKARRLILVFRMFNDGLGFRYELPEQKSLADFAIMNEVTEFNLAHDAMAWWIPAMDAERYEYLYRLNPVNDIAMAHTPLTLESESGLFRVSCEQRAMIHRLRLFTFAPSAACSGVHPGGLFVCFRWQELCPLCPLTRCYYYR